MKNKSDSLVLDAQYVKTNSVETSKTILGDASWNVIAHHLSSFVENDLEAVIADYTDESVLITQDASFKGPAEIRTFFIDLMTHFPKQKSNFELDKVVIEDELVYIVWHANTPSVDVPFASDTFIVKDGKIYRQTFAGQMKFIN